MTYVDSYCPPCGEVLAEGQVECPFCGQAAILIDDYLDRVCASGMETRSAIDPKGRGPEGDSPTAEGGDAQTASHPKDIA